MESKVTNYGEEYNRESMYETARERFFDGKKVKMGGSRHKSLISIMIKDFEMELEKEEKLLKQSKIKFKQKDDKNFINTFSKTMERSRVTDDLHERIEKAVKHIKDIQKTYSKYLNGNFDVKKTSKMSLDELNSILSILKEYEEKLLEGINGDCLNTTIYKTLTITQLYIQEIELEIKNRQTNIFEK